MFSDEILSEISPMRLKEIFREVTNGEFILSVSQKVNKIKIDSRKSFQIFEGVDEVDLLVSSREHTATPDLLDGVQDYRKRRINPDQRVLRDELERWIKEQIILEFRFIYLKVITLRGQGTEIDFLEI